MAIKGVAIEAFPEPECAKLASELYTRATHLLRFSYGYLAAIVLLIAIAILVFFTAAQVTLSDLSHNPAAAIQSMRDRERDIASQIRQLTEETDRQKQLLNLALGSFLLSTTHMTVAPGSAAGGLFNNNCCSRLVLKFSELAELLQKTLESALPTPNNAYLISFTFGTGLSETGTLKKEDWEKLIGALRKLPEPLSDEQLNGFESSIKQLNELETEQRRLWDTDQEVQRQQNVADASKILGKSDNEGSQTADIRLQLIQTSITRFGTITLIVFVVGIVSSLYRYTVKLAGFYRAQADALTLHSVVKSITDLSTLSAVLTPTLDFGKPPATPVEQVVSLLKALPSLTPKPE